MKDQLSPPKKTKNELPSEVSSTLQLDHDKYRDYLKDHDMTIEHQNELLETLWHIMRTFVELSFDLDNVELFTKQKDQDSGNPAIDLISIDDSTQKFNQVANL